MASKLTIDSDIADTLPAPTVDWFHDSELADDLKTRDVVEGLREARRAYPKTLEPAVTEALTAAFFHRIDEVEVTADGEPVESVDDMPGGLAPSTRSILRGFRGRTDHANHCSGLDERAGAAMLNMAVRWSNGTEAYTWTLDVVDDCYGDKHVESMQRSALEDIQEGLIGG